jgi:hypothetical protein
MKNLMKDLIISMKNALTERLNKRMCFSANGQIRSGEAFAARQLARLSLLRIDKWLLLVVRAFMDPVIMVVSRVSANPSEL